MNTTVADRPIRVGLIGAGGIAGAHLRGYAAHADRIQVSADADVDGAAAAARAAEVGATPYQDLGTMIAEADIDAVDVCLPHHLHADATVAAADAGKHVLCEKPLCLAVDEAERVRRAVTDNRVTLMCAHNQLFLPPVAAAVDLLRSGLLGQFAEGEDSAQVLVRFADGVLGHLVTSWACQAADCTEKFSVVGELGALWATKSELSYRLRDGTTETLGYDAVDTFTAEIGHFAECLAAGTRPLHNEVEGIQVLGIILAAYESARTRQVVTVTQ